ncbi:alpha/beta hydrolase [Campylobacter jejuni]|nr:alpha/beta hydrolase [Campylobacter jejuni]
MKLYKYARMCWASYSTGLNEGMFGKEDKKWGLKNQTQYYTKQDIEMLKENNINSPTYFQAITQSSMLVLDTYNISFDEDNANEFINRYEVLAFIQDDDTSFSATLFKDTKDNELILAFRGIDIFQFSFSFWDSIKAGAQIFRSQVPLEYYLQLLKFYDDKVRHFLGNDKLIVTGHCFGGYLAQLFVLSFPQSVKALYTYNAMGVYENEYTKYTNYIGNKFDDGIEILGYNFNIFDANLKNIKLIPITQELKNNIILKDNSIAFKEDTPYEVKELFPNNIKSQKNTTQLYLQIQNAPLDFSVIFKELDYNSVYTLTPIQARGFKNLIENLLKGNEEFSKLLNAEIYKIYTIDLDDSEEIFQKFGTHIKPNEIIALKLDYFKLQLNFKFDGSKKSAESVFGFAKKATILKWILVLISIEDICEELLKQSRIKDDEPSLHFFYGWEEFFRDFQGY